MLILIKINPFSRIFFNASHSNTSNVNLNLAYCTLALVPDFRNSNTSNVNLNPFNSGYLIPFYVFKYI